MRAALPIVATNEVYFASPDDYEAHDALLCIAEGRYVVEDDRRRLSREHFFKTAEQMGDAVRRPAGGAGQHGRDRPALRLPPDGPQADPAALRRRRRGRQRGASCSSWRRPSCASRPRPAWSGGSPTAPPAPGFTVEDYRQAARLRDRRDLEDEVPRLLPDRCRLHQVGQVERHSRRPGPRLGRRLGGRPGRSPSPTSIRCASACCSSASSIPSACRCRTSTSTSARTAATR